MYAGMDGDIKRLIEIFKTTPGAIQYAEPGKPFIFASKRKSNVKIFADAVLDNEEGAEIIGRLVSGKILELEEIDGKEYKIAGVANGGAKVAELATGVLGRRYVSVNPHDGGGVVGEIYEGMNCIMCEDVTTVGSSILKCYERFLKPKKAAIRHTIAIVDRQEGAGENIWNKLKAKHNYFLTKQELDVYDDSF